MFRGLTGRAGAAIVALLVSITAVACDRGDAQEQGDEERLTACELLTSAEASAAFGGEVRRPAATDDEGADALAGRSGCAWSTRDGASAALFELVRTDDMAPSVRRTGFSATARFSAARGRHPDASGVEVGDRSLWVEEIGTLYVLAGSSYLVVEVATHRPGAAAPVAKALAEAAVARLRRADADRLAGADAR